MKKPPTTLLIMLFIFVLGMAQIPPGISEINEGKLLMAQNFRALSSAVLVLVAIFGLLGGLRVYSNWQMGRRNIDAEVAAGMELNRFFLI